MLSSRPQRARLCGWAELLGISSAGPKVVLAFVADRDCVGVENGTASCKRRGVALTIIAWGGSTAGGAKQRQPTRPFRTTRRKRHAATNAVSRALDRGHSDNGARSDRRRTQE